MYPSMIKLAPWLMLFSRMVLFAGFQALIAGFLALAGSSHTLGGSGRMVDGQRSTLQSGFH